MKIYISQPMLGESHASIIKARARAICFAEKEYPGCFIVDSLFSGTDWNAVRCLAESLKKLAEADVAVFVKGWEKARGCQVEHMVAEKYGIGIEEMTE